ncbi:MAG TPA: efflux RND transporter periplasmic adaptor subunit [Burkholderiales bacterium]|nr:efflux RND transporter periplasmic adaptor subunit [Burkholderiales bacterium]
MSADPLDNERLEDIENALKRRKVLRRAKLITAVALVLLVLGAGRTVMSRISNDKALKADLAEQSKIYVKTATPKAGGVGQAVSLPGTLQGNVQAPIAARASGYLKRWHKDIGSHVKKGDLLAEIDSPEIDQQLSQAIAARDQAAASLNLAMSTMARWEALRKKDAVSQQELEERRGAAAQARANLAAADANVERLRQLQGFKRVVAPFSGVVTRRNVDVGDLIDAGGGAGRTMFVLSQIDSLRIYVSVPQAYAQNVKVGQKVAVTQAELSGQTFEGRIARTAGAIDTATRTMQVEVTLRNPDGVLMPGAYVQVQLPLEGGKAMTIPTNALLIRGDGVQVAVLDPEKRVQLRPIRIGRNYGQNVEVLEGLEVTEHVVLNPPDSLSTGDQVVVAPAQPAATKGKQAAKAAQ